MIPENIVKALRERYDIHPLIFHRSLERSKTAGELFDMLDTMPKAFPLVWNEEQKKWETTKDLFQAKKFSQE